MFTPIILANKKMKKSRIYHIPKFNTVEDAETHLIYVDENEIQHYLNGEMYYNYIKQEDRTGKNQFEFSTVLNLNSKNEYRHKVNDKTVFYAFFELFGLTKHTMFFKLNIDGKYSDVHKYIDKYIKPSYDRALFTGAWDELFHEDGPFYNHRYFTTNDNLEFYIGEFTNEKLNTGINIVKENIPLYSEVDDVILGDSENRKETIKNNLEDLLKHNVKFIAFIADIHVDADGDLDTTESVLFFYMTHMEPYVKEVTNKSIEASGYPLPIGENMAVFKSYWLNDVQDNELYND